MKWCLCSGFIDAENQAAHSRGLSGSYSAPEISACWHSGQIPLWRAARLIDVLSTVPGSFLRRRFAQ
jgi:hypothetical protein